MTKAIFCLASNDEQAQRIVEHLISSGFNNEDISILYPDRSKGNLKGNGRIVHERADVEIEDFSNENRVSSEEYQDTYPNEYRDPSKKVRGKKGNLTTEKHTKAPEGGALGGAVGGVLGGTLGLLTGIGALAIPGLGPFIAAGPLLAALSGSGIGGGIGLLVGALVGAGIPEYEAKQYESGLKAGNILISVHTESSEEINRANEIMKKEGAKDISTSREKTRSKY